MNLTSLYHKLVTAYTQENLQKITRTIIDLHKSKQTAALMQLMTTVDEHQSCGQTSPPKNSDSDGRAFYRLMMTYHPDRLSVYRGEIDKLYAAKNFNGLQTYAHIFSVLELEQTLVAVRTPHPSSSAYSDLWETIREEFDRYDQDETLYDDELYEDVPMDTDETDETIPRHTFYTVFKQQMYGTQNVELPTYYFEDIETLDLSGCEMERLDGIQYCTQLVAVDLSNNRLDDITELASLTQLQEIYLGGNRIGYVDGLAFLKNLRAVDLSFNDIDDLSPLFELHRLEYVNVAGNPVPSRHIAFLQKKGIVVLS